MCNTTLCMQLGTIAKESPEIKYSQNIATLRAHNSGWNQPSWKGRQKALAIKRAGILKHLKPGLGKMTDRQQLRVFCIDPVTS